MYRLMKSVIVPAAAVAALFAVCASCGTAFAQNEDSIADVNQSYPYYSTAQLGPCIYNGGAPAVVNMVLSKPGTVNGVSYSSWAFYVNDGTGGADVYSSSASLSALNYTTVSGGTATGYTPTAGDGLDIKGEWEPYHSFGELYAPSKLTVVSTGNTVPAPAVVTVGGVLDDLANNANPQLTGTSGTKSTTTVVMPDDLSGQIVTLDNVTLAWGATTAPVTKLGTANVSAILLDGTAPLTLSGSNFMSGEVSAFQTGDGITYNPATQGAALAFYYWPTSYSVANQNLDGTSIDFTGATHYNMTGFLSDYPGLPGGLAEFSPLSITPVTAVPEPGTMALLGAGTMAAAVSYVRRKRRLSTLRTQ